MVGHNLLQSSATSHHDWEAACHRLDDSKAELLNPERTRMRSEYENASGAQFAGDILTRNAPQNIEPWSRVCETINCRF